MAASQKLCRLNARLLEKKVKSIMRILTDPAFNNVVKSVPLCHSNLFFFLKAKIITWMGDKLKASMEEKNREHFSEERTSAEVSHW